MVVVVAVVAPNKQQDLASRFQVIDLIYSKTTPTVEVAQQGQRQQLQQQRQQSNSRQDYYWQHYHHHNCKFYCHVIVMAAHYARLWPSALGGSPCSSCFMHFMAGG